jgi:hypothetical protein
MNLRDGTRRKDTCLNAVSSITGSHAPQRILRTWGAAMQVICRRGLYRLSVAEDNPLGRKLHHLD